MGTSVVERFESSLGELGVSMTRTGAADFEAAIASLVGDPAVGVPLAGYEGVSLSGTDIETPPTPRRLKDSRTGVTPVGKAIAEYGTLLLDSDSVGTEPVSLYPPHHVGIVRESDVLPTVDAAGEHLRDRFAAGTSSIFATGVSSTGDMGSLVEGVHGPKEVDVVLITDR
ncbi:MAG: LUD domain-containing protein [Halobacteriota archaeon]|uniref:LUD domain-containing protein n=1 Tax=Natronomonas sp. TaxID=2184060 RepID=UPI003975FD64